LNSYMIALMDSIRELQERAVRDANPEYEKKAKSVQSKLEKVEQGKIGCTTLERSWTCLRIKGAL